MDVNARGVLEGKLGATAIVTGVPQINVWRFLHGLSVLSPWA